jgi:outer membrane protein TolC
MNKLLLIALLLTTTFHVSAQQLKEVTTLSLNQTILLARGQSPAAKQAQTRLKNRYWQYRLYRSNYNPQLALSGNIPGYNQDFLTNRLDDGTISFIEREQFNSGLNMSLNQPIALTGGNLSVNSDLNYFADRTFDLRRFSSTLVNVQLNQPLFAFNDLKWDRRTEPLRYEESKRGFVEEMEFVSRETVTLYFDHLDAQINYQIASFNLLSNDTVYKIEQGRYNIGNTSKDKLLQVELQLLRSQQDVSQALLDLETSGLLLRNYLGLRTADTLVLLPPDEIPAFEIPAGDALNYAHLNRSDYVAFERRRLEALREVAEARGQQVQTNLIASYGLNAAGGDLNTAYLDPNVQKRLDIGLSVPILDWGRNKARMQTALANKELNDFVIEQDVQNFDQEIITLVRRFAMLRNQLRISQKSDEVADERYKVAQNRYLTGKVDITDLNIALREKDEAKRSYVSALRDFWIAYFDLRRLTLYDFAENRLLYTPEGEE